MPDYTQQLPVEFIGDASIVTRSMGNLSIEIEMEDATGNRAKVTASPGQVDQLVISLLTSRANSAQP